MENVYQYNIQKPGDKTKFIIYSMKKLRRSEQSQIFEKFMKTVTHTPSIFSQDVIVFDDRPVSIR